MNETWEHGQYSVLRVDGIATYMRVDVSDPRIKYIWYKADNAGFLAGVPNSKCDELEKKYQESKQ